MCICQEKTSVSDKRVTFVMIKKFPKIVNFDENFAQFVVNSRRRDADGTTWSRGASGEAYQFHQLTTLSIARK